MSRLDAFVAAELDRPVQPIVREAARTVAGRLGGAAVLFYGSVLRTAELDGVLDFYVLRGSAASTGLMSRLIWPDVSYQEVEIDGQTLRAKVAAMQIDTFERAARGLSRDTTIWARFVQPSALIWAEDDAIRQRVIAAVTDAARTAGRFTALHGAGPAPAAEFWRSLFRATYATELRVEPPGREEQILGHDRARYEALLPLAWASGGIAFGGNAAALVPHTSERQLRTIAAAWMRAARAGKWLNLLRLIKAAFTFEGAARYGLWKIERHTGVRFALTPFREHHPIMAAPGVFWRLWRRRA